MTWNWHPARWKKSTKLLLGIATIWPIVYMGLFFVLIFGGIFLSAMFAEPSRGKTTTLDLIQLERKIQAGEISELRIGFSEIQAIDRAGRAFQTDVNNESTREEIIRQARELDANGKPRVAKIDENSSEPRINSILPVGFVGLFALHIMTMFLLFGLMPLYIILPLKNDRLDQSMRIVWVVLSCTMGIFADPVYWYLYVWRRGDDNSMPVEAA